MSTKAWMTLHCSPVVPEYAPSTFTHHLTPAALLALLKTLYQAEPTGHLVSIRGYDFDFHRNLSEKTGALVEPAAACILRFLKYYKSGGVRKCPRSH